MNKKLLGIAVSVFMCLSIAKAQPAVDQKAILFTMGKTPVTVGEFLYTYNKNNINNSADYSEKSLQETLDLYVNFRLKVQEALDMKMDTISKLNDELMTYRNQLAKSYLFDKEVENKLIDEAFDREHWDVRASVIYMAVKKDAAPKDTLAVYNKMVSVRNEILKKGKTFEDEAVKYSEDPSKNDTKGDVGYITALQVSYPLESAIYNTPVGQLSMPVRTKTGYYLVKTTDKRAARGQIQVEHILFRTGDGADAAKVQTASSNAAAAYQQLVGGANFETLVAQISEDQNTKGSNGILPWFGIRKYPASFEDAAFALKNDGDYSQPVQTDAGFHILKRIGYQPIPTVMNAELKEDLKSKIEKDSRFNLAKAMLVKQIKAQYGFTENSKTLDAVIAKTDTNILSGKWRIPATLSTGDVLFTIKDKNYTSGDFANFMQSTQKKKQNTSVNDAVKEYYSDFVEKSAMDYKEAQLDNENMDFKNLMTEYKQGVLLFELAQQKVWERAGKDTVGLKAFYGEHKTDYMWGQRADVTIFNSKDAATSDKIKKWVMKGWTLEKIKAKLGDAAKDFSTENGLFEKGQRDMVDKYPWHAGSVSASETNSNGTVSFVKYNSIHQPEPKELNETKGPVLNDYQLYLEQEWIAELKSKYPVKIDQTVFHSLIKKS